MANNINWIEVEKTGKEYSEWYNKQQRNINTLAGQLSDPLTGSAAGPNPFTGTKLPIKTPGRPVGSKTKDREVIIQETVDRLVEQAVKLLTKHDFNEDSLGDAEIVVDEKANYAFVTVTVATPDKGIISVSERVKVANKTDPSKNWQNLNKAFYAASAKKVVQKLDEDLSNIYITTGPSVDFTNNDF